MRPIERIAIAAVALSMSFATSRGHAIEIMAATTDSAGEIATTSPAAAPPKAPVGHRQPNARNVPARVLQEERTIDRSEADFDKRLQICIRC